MQCDVQEDDSIVHQVYVCARDGDLNIRKLLDNRSRAEVQQILESRTTEEGQCTSPFIIAARNGHVQVVDILLREYGADIEQTGTVKFDGYTIEGATALWCSAGAGHYSVVKLLYELGADVNHTTTSNSTPLRAACFDGRLEIVKYLIRNGADVHIANKYKNTCLMIASYKGHKDVVSFLLQHGARANDKAHCGATALHFAAERGHLDIVKKLVQNKADLSTNEHHLSPLHLAAEGSRAEVVEFFVTHPNVCRKDYIDALELLGASYANDKDNYNVEKCYHFLWLAMQERYRLVPPLLKKVNPPEEAYDGHVECQTVAEIESIKDNHLLLHMEALVVRERILGSDNAEIPHAIVFRGAVFADTARFDRCIALWMRAMYLRQRNNRSISKDLLRFAQVFSQMMHVGVSVAFTAIRDVFNYALTELAKDQTRIDKLAVSSEERNLAEDVKEVNIHSTLYLMVIITKTKCTDDEYLELYKLIYKFINMKLTVQSQNQCTSLHMACDEATTVDDFHVNDVVKFPNDALVKMLLACGANVNATDKVGNTPLHYIVKYNRPISDFLTLHNIITNLCQAGGHMDQTNKEGLTPNQISTTGVADIILRTQRKLHLTCLAAAAVKKHQLNYQGKIPSGLEEFVSLH